MANPRFSKQAPERGATPPPNKKGHRPDATPERVPNYGGPPGKTQPRSRDKAGTPKTKVYPQSEGL